MEILRAKGLTFTRPGCAYSERAGRVRYAVAASGDAFVALLRRRRCSPARPEWTALIPLMAEIDQPMMVLLFKSSSLIMRNVSKFA